MNTSDFGNGDDIKRALSEAGEKIREELGSIAENIDIEELKKAGEKFADDAATLVKKYPVQSALAAFAVGCLVGSALGRRR